MPGGGNYNRSSETRNKLSTSVKEYYKLHPTSDTTKAKISKAMTGRKHSQETKDKIASSRRGKPHTHKPHKFGTASRAKISAANKGKHYSPSTEFGAKD